MAPSPHRTTSPQRTTRLTAASPLFGPSPERPQPPPTTPRYPSLSDDGQPYFPRWQRKLKTGDDSGSQDHVWPEGKPAAFLSVRLIAILAILLLTALLLLRG